MKRLILAAAVALCAPAAVRTTVLSRRARSRP